MTGPQPSAPTPLAMVPVQWQRLLGGAVPAFLSGLAPAPRAPQEGGLYAAAPLASTAACASARASRVS